LPLLLGLNELLHNRNPPYTRAKTARMETITRAYRRWLPLPRLSFWFWAFTALAVAIGTRVIVRRVKEDRWEF